MLAPVSSFRAFFVIYYKVEVGGVGSGRSGGERGDMREESAQLEDSAQRLLDLETRVLGLEVKLSVVEKESSANSETIDTQPKVSIYGGNRIRK